MRAFFGICAMALISGEVLAKSEHGFQLISETYEIASPQFDGPTDIVANQILEPVFVQTVLAENTPWVRVHFSRFHLGSGSYLILSSPRDGEWQKLESWSMEVWLNTSAIFNGDEVQIELYAAPGDTGVFFEIDQLLVADPEDFANFDATPVPVIEASICGELDDRVPSNDPRVGRLFFGGCTGWLVHNGAGLTAGHCGTPDGNITGVMEYNVPISNSNGAPNAASTNDQYPVTAVTGFESDGEGDDWAVFRVGANSNTGLRPELAQGFFHMTSLVPAEGETVRVTGYGIDPFPAGTGGTGAPCCDWDDDGDCNFSCNARNVTQQTDTGACDDCLVDGDAIDHEVDTMPANSGSPVIWNSLDIAIAIHTNGGCDTVLSDFDNSSTWLGDNPLENRMGAFLPNRIWADAVSPHFLRTGGLLNAFRNMSEVASSAPTGSTVAIVAGSYPAAAGNVATFSRAMTLTAPIGLVRLGN
ncbi:MAG: serine protease [Phycisphaerae bacterium]